MKELDSFTVERLEELTALSFPPSHHELAALARIALAAKRAEPVAWVVGDATLYNSDTVEAYAKRSGLPVSPPYTTPQPAHTDQANFYIVLNDGQPYDVFSDKDKAALYAADASGLFSVLPVFTTRQPFEAPRGWKLVPEIPDAQMLRAWKDANYNNASLEGAFNKMVNAAPKPESE